MHNAYLKKAVPMPQNTSRFVEDDYCYYVIGGTWIYRIIYNPKDSLCWRIAVFTLASVMTPKMLQNNPIQ